MDAKLIAVNGLKRACTIFLQDLQAIPPGAFCQSLGPKARTVADIVYEVNLVNDDIGMEIRGEVPAPWPDEGFIRAPADFSEKEQIIAAFETSSQSVLTTVEGYSSEQMEEPIQTGEGEATRFERCRFMTLHLWYHSGQLNFIQTLLGDDAWHWN